jgi:type IV secretory pathway VirB10-like protein
MDDENGAYDEYGGENFESVNDGAKENAEEMTVIDTAEFQSVNDGPKESAAKLTAVKGNRGAPRFDRDKVIRIAMVSLGILVVAGVAVTNIQKKAEEAGSESRRAGRVNVPEEFKRRLSASAREEGAEVEGEGGESIEDIEAEVYGYLPGYTSAGGKTESPPPPQSPPVPVYPASGVQSGAGNRPESGGAVTAAAPAPDPALTAKLIPQVEGNGSVYSGQATAPQAAGVNPLGDVYGQAARYLQTAGYPAYPQTAYPQAAYPQAAYPQTAYPQTAYPQAAYTPQMAYPQTAYPQAAYPQTAYPQAAQYIPPQPAGQQAAAPYGQQPTTAANGLNQQGYEAQNMQSDKQEFYDTGGGGGGGLVNGGYYLGEDTLWNGVIIPAVLVTGINTDLPGEVMARVSQNVYDSLTGKHLLIPKGTILMARYNSSVSYAQGRVQIIWNTLTRPDGYQVELGGMNGVDERGMSGQRGEYHENWFQYLKAAGIITMFTLANGEMSRAAGASVNSDVAAANQNIVNQLAGNITARALNIQPTITVKSGEKINVMLNKAVYLPPVEGYKPAERYRR